MEFVRQQTLHTILVKDVYEFLIEENFPDSISKNERIILNTGESIYPDIVNRSKKLVYEIHVKGERKGKYFDKLPDGWKGINVFYDDEDNPETLIIKLGTNEIERIKWKTNNIYMILCNFEHTRFYDEIKNSSKWCKLNGAWLIYTDENAHEIYGRLEPYLYKDTDILIIDVGKDSQGLLSKGAWKWIKKYTSSKRRSSITKPSDIVKLWTS